MKKVISILQSISRLLLLVVGIALIAGSLFFTGVHMANKNLEKQETTGIIVRGDDGLKEVSYQFDGKELRARPLDTYFRSLGNINDKLTVYVEVEHPERIFITYHGDNLMSIMGFMAGWGLLLLIILLGERQLMKRMKNLEQIEEDKGEVE